MEVQRSTQASKIWRNRQTGRLVFGLLHSDWPVYIRVGAVYGFDIPGINGKISKNFINNVKSVIDSPNQGVRAVSTGSAVDRPYNFVVRAQEEQTKPSLINQKLKLMFFFSVLIFFYFIKIVVFWWQYLLFNIKFLFVFANYQKNILKKKRNLKIVLLSFVQFQS